MLNTFQYVIGLFQEDFHQFGVTLNRITLRRNVFKTRRRAIRCLGRFDRCRGWRARTRRLNNLVRHGKHLIELLQTFRKERIGANGLPGCQAIHHRNQRFMAIMSQAEELLTEHEGIGVCG